MLHVLFFDSIPKENEHQADEYKIYISWLDWIIISTAAHFGTSRLADRKTNVLVYPKG